MGLANSYHIAIIMITAPDPETAYWLSGLMPDDGIFDWDDGNRSKNERKHGVSDEDIESLIRIDGWVFAGRIIEPVGQEWRGLILGESAAGRSLALIFTRRGGRIRPISCRSMRAEEKKRYAAAKTQA